MDWAIYVIAAVIGASIGSFLNVVIYRVPKGVSVIRPRSSCPSCGDEIRPWQNVPVLSFLLLRGRCGSCGRKIGVRYLVVELLTSMLWVIAAVRFDGIEVALFVATAGSVLIALAAIDLECRRVPNVIVLPAVAVGAGWVVIAGLVSGNPDLILGSLAGGAVSFALLFVIALVSGGMGFGDVKLAAFTGIACGRFGFPVAVAALLLAFVLGGLAAIVLILMRRAGRKDALPFAPALCLGALTAMFGNLALVRAWLP